MKKIAVVAVFAVVAAHAAAAHAGVNFNVDVYAGPPPVVVTSPPPVLTQPAVVPAQLPTVVYAAPPPRPIPAPAPRFVYSSDLGYYVSYEPYDMAYIDRCYYQYRGGGWLMSSSYAGPWVAVRGRALPPELWRFSYSDYRYYRDLESHRNERGGRYARWHDHDRDHDRWERRTDRW